MATSRRAPSPARRPSTARAELVRHAALLRGVSPTNASMPALVRCFEAAGFTRVTTVLASGNVIFSAPPTDAAALVGRITAAMGDSLDRTFPVIVRTGDALAALLAADPWPALGPPATAKRVVTFFPRPLAAGRALPAPVDGVHIHALTAGRGEALTSYLPHPRGPVFMTTLERTFGKDITTRTWDTVTKLVRACAAP